MISLPAGNPPRPAELESMRWYLPDSNPMLWDELRRRLRGGQSYLITAIYVTVFSGVLLGMTYMVRPGVDPADWPDFGRTLWLYVMLGQLVLTIITAPGLTATAFTAERERQTLDALLLTRISSRALAVGKLLGATMQLWLIVLAGLPVVSIVLFIYGGVAPYEVILSYLLVLAAGMYCAAQGLMVSCKSASTPEALAKAYPHALLALLVISLCSLCYGVGVIFMCFDISRSIHFCTDYLDELRQPALAVTFSEQPVLLGDRQ